MKKKIAMLGAGAWGTAVATVLANNGHDVTLWCFECDVVDAIKKVHRNERYLPTIALNPSVTATNDLARAVADADVIFEATPIAFLRAVLLKAKPHVKPHVPWVVLSKGIENDTLMLPSSIIQDVLGLTTNVAVVAGPTFAQELAQGKFSAAVVASDHAALCNEIISLLANAHFMLQSSNDLLGVQVGGAVKNVIALAIGIARGAKQTENTIAYLVTEGLAELAKIIELFGGKKETAMSLAGLGDLVLTCMGTLSKNLRVGMMIGSGSCLHDIKAKPGIVLPEGVNTIKSLDELAGKKGIRLPLCRGAYECIFEGKPFDVMLDLVRSAHNSGAL